MNTSKYSLILLLIICLAGCATDSRQRGTASDQGHDYSGSNLAVTAKLRFEDIPTPVGFKLLQDQSFVFQTENTRVALLKYAGRANLVDLVEFYKEQMPPYNWELLNIIEYDKSLLNFQRSNQTCLVSIETKGLKKVITISLAPKATGQVKEPKTQTK